MNYVASQYAMAAFSLAGDTKSWKEFKTVWDQTILSIDQETLKFFIHPGIKKTEKKKVVDNIISNPLVKHLFFVLIDNRRLDLIHEISVEYNALLNKMNQTLEVTVYSKLALTEVQATSLKKRLFEQHQREISLNNVIDSTIIAGYKYEYEGYVIDETVNRQLDNLKTHLKK
jgi:F-type H+-transporting ATPase subunit delta